jgi:hypothetical protein
MIYLKITSGGTLALRDAMRTEFARTHPDNNLSINVKSDGTAGWAKVIDDTGLTDAFPGQITDRVESRAEHASKVQRDIYADGWYSDEGTETV